MQDTQPRFFYVTLGLALIGAATMLCIYSLLVKGILPSGNVPSNHKWFLIEHAPANVIVIEGGSSAHHGIDAAEIAKTFGRKSINVADQAGYHLLDKARRLDRILPDDATVIVNIEWIHAFREKPTNVYIDHISKYNGDYLTSLSWPNRVSRSLNFSPSVLFDIATREKEPISFDHGRFGNIRGRMFHPVYRYGGYTFSADDREPEEWTATQTCDDYLMTGIENPEFASKSFRAAVKVFGKMKKGGSDVFFVWPSVVDEGCYNKPDFQIMENTIRTVLAEEGLEILGRPEDARYPARLMDNTYYHLGTAGRKIHTGRLIGLLQDKVSKIDTDDILSAQVSHYMNEMSIIDKTITERRLSTAPHMRVGLSYRPADSGSSSGSAPVRITNLRSSRESQQIALPGSKIIMNAPPDMEDRGCLALKLGSTPKENSFFTDENGHRLIQVSRDAGDYIFEFPATSGSNPVSFTYNSSGSTIGIVGVRWISQTGCRLGE